MGEAIRIPEISRPTSSSHSPNQRAGPHRPRRCCGHHKSEAAPSRAGRQASGASRVEEFCLSRQRRSRPARTERTRTSTSATACRRLKNSTFNLNKDAMRAHKQTFLLGPNRQNTPVHRVGHSLNTKKDQKRPQRHQMIAQQRTDDVAEQTIPRADDQVERQDSAESVAELKKPVWTNHPRPGKWPFHEAILCSAPTSARTGFAVLPELPAEPEACRGDCWLALGAGSNALLLRRLRRRWPPLSPLTGPSSLLLDPFCCRHCWTRDRRWSGLLLSPGWLLFGGVWWNPKIRRLL